MPKQSHRRTVLTYGVIAVLAVAAYAYGGQTVPSQDNSKPDTTPAGKPAGPCDGWGKLERDPNRGGKVESEGWKPKNPKTAQAEYLELLKRNPHELFLAYNITVQGRKKPLTEAQLVDGECLSARGREAWTHLQRNILLGSSRPENAPAFGSNSGVKRQRAYMFTGKITGDRRATKFVLADGTVFWVLHRCANVVTVSKPPPVIPQPVKCPDQGICGTPSSGPEQQPVQSNPCCNTGPTSGYTRGNAEQVVGTQPRCSDCYNRTPSGTDSGGGAGSAPPGTDGTTSGTNEGTTDVEGSEGSGETSGTDSDPGEP